MQNIFKNANLRLANQEKVKWQIKSHNFFLGFAESYAEYQLVFSLLAKIVKIAHLTFSRDTQNKFLGSGDAEPRRRCD